MERPGEKLNSVGILRQHSGDLPWQSVGYTLGRGEVPLLSIQDGILGHEVPAFQQKSLLELVMSVDYIGTSPVNGMVMGSRTSRQGRLCQVNA